MLRVMERDRYPTDREGHRLWRAARHFTMAEVRWTVKPSVWLPESISKWGVGAGSARERRQQPPCCSPPVRSRLVSAAGGRGAATEPSHTDEKPTCSPARAPGGPRDRRTGD